ncbi:MAG TPA: phosphoribosylaminoimidazolesuccinocarboxamide synthase [Persephonella sp.]|uniref:Phosphoribosylaminoimidazole-succinocarboxamide synthase n=1 Tax=Persephonella marina (strain DSM 14350 / EX-H1) TaxID=123214 RepID=PUR7_PERMH|nr:MULTISPECIES: phosphoribosylaminoimidazolesuccinocarboxamide synthase [Persephonella]C0QUE7.1 RecName: Full=Phosphoribosylaminoimidazole-succinocarboxamide synthase; AltName: Full=SAICAR synthetase [Persephonella marina EX-H1]ACO03521.1 phosphoribosylaminoimidazolesuccinocarboxamide synthase [Persephonella marina EX-H1]HCB70069.1 phosphoribosylaminoimidazolesuccinocarboxamide synthase [Persephonella sp.]
MEKREKLYEGKAKIIYATDEPDKVIAYYKDSATAFDAIKKATIEGKGVLNNKIASFFFQLLNEKGIPTHFIKQISDREMLIYKVDIIPVEVVVRNIAAGSIVKRLGIPEKKEFDPPLVEFYLKNDELHDPIICEQHIYAMDLAKPEEVQKMKELALKVNDVLREFMREQGIILVDFKLEFGRKDGQIILADEISPDTCRFWDAKTGEKLDKDRFRFDLGDLIEGYTKILEKIQKKEGE